MPIRKALRRLVKQQRKHGALWVRAFDKIRLLSSADGLSVLVTSILRSSDIHQTTTYTEPDRYPALFDYAVRIAPEADRILSFGCATGEEIFSLRARFPGAEIIGVEINARCRRIARRQLAGDRLSKVVSTPPHSQRFDLIFALAVLQREPHRVIETDERNLRSHYPFDRFDETVARLVELLAPEGILLVQHSQYRIEDWTGSAELKPLADSPPASGPFFGPDGGRHDDATSATAFRKMSFAVDEDSAALARIPRQSSRETRSTRS